MPPKRGARGGRGGASRGQPQKESQVDETMSDAPESSPATISNADTAEGSSSRAVDIEMGSPNLSPASAPTETPAPTPVRAPVERLESLTRTPQKRGSGMTGRFRPRAIVRPPPSHEDLRRREEIRQAALRQAQQDQAAAASSASISRGRGSSTRAGISSYSNRSRASVRGRGRGRGDAMGRRNLDLSRVVGGASGPLSILPSHDRVKGKGKGKLKDEGSTSSTSTFKEAQPRKRISERQTKQKAARAEPSSPEIKAEPGTVDAMDLDENSENESKPKIKAEFPEPQYPSDGDDEDDGTVRRVNIEEIDLISDDEDEPEDDIPLVQSRAALHPFLLPIRHKGPLRPIRLERREHKERETIVNTEPAAAPALDEETGGESSELFVPNDESAELKFQRRLDYFRDGKRWQGVWQPEEDEAQVKPDPDSTSSQARQPIKKRSKEQIKPESEAKHKAKAKAKVVKKPVKASRPPVLQTEEDKAEYQRHDEDIHILAQELGDLQGELGRRASTVAADDVGGEGVVKDKEGRLYLFQFPPILPPLYNPIKKEEEEADVEMTGVQPVPTGVKDAPVDLTKNPQDAVVIKEEVDGAGPSNPGVFTVAPELIPEEGYIGKLVVRESGKVELSWGGTSLALGRGSEFNFLTTTVMLDGVDDKEPAGGVSGHAHNESGFVGRAIGMGKVMGKFVVTPDWEKILHDE